MTNLTYDTTRRVTAVTFVTDLSTGAGDTYSFTYNTDNTVVTDPRGNKTTHYHDKHARVTKTVDALGRTRSTGYTSSSNVANYTNAGNAKTTNSYSSDGLDNLTKVERPTGSGTILTSSYAYGDAANPYSPTKYTDPSAEIVNYSYDTRRNLTKITSGSAATNPYDFTYNTNGTLASAKDPNGNLTSYSYDLKGNLTTI